MADGTEPAAQMSDASIVPPTVQTQSANPNESNQPPPLTRNEHGSTATESNLRQNLNSNSSPSIDMANAPNSVHQNPNPSIDTANALNAVLQQQHMFNLHIINQMHQMQQQMHYYHQMSSPAMAAIANTQGTPGMAHPNSSSPNLQTGSPQMQQQQHFPHPQHQSPPQSPPHSQQIRPSGNNFSHALPTPAPNPHSPVSNPHPSTSLHTPVPNIQSVPASNPQALSNPHPSSNPQTVSSRDMQRVHHLPHLSSEPLQSHPTTSAPSSPISLSSDSLQSSIHSKSMASGSSQKFFLESSNRFSDDSISNHSSHPYPPSLSQGQSSSATSIHGSDVANMRSYVNDSHWYGIPPPAPPLESFNDNDSSHSNHSVNRLRHRDDDNQTTSPRPLNLETNENESRESKEGCCLFVCIAGLFSGTSAFAMCC